jgi:hypothetical protein
MSPGEWDALPWDMQMTYWDGMVSEGLVQEVEPQQERGVPQIAARQAEGGADVIDIQALIRDSQEAQRAASG